MNWILFLLFAGVVVWIAFRFLYYYQTATATGLWGKLVEAAGDSATYFVAKTGIFFSALLGLVTMIGDLFATTPEAKAAFHEWMTGTFANPTAVAVGGIGVMVLVWWARSRTMGT